MLFLRQFLTLFVTTLAILPFILFRLAEAAVLPNPPEWKARSVRERTTQPDEPSWLKRRRSTSPGWRRWISRSLSPSRLEDRKAGPQDAPPITIAVTRRSDGETTAQMLDRRHATEVQGRAAIPGVFFEPRAYGKRQSYGGSSGDGGSNGDGGTGTDSGCCSGDGVSVKINCSLPQCPNPPCPL